VRRKEASCQDTLSHLATFRTAATVVAGCASALQGDGGGCQCREAPFKKWVVGPPSSIFASFHSAAYRGSSLLLLPRFRCLLFSIIVKQQPKHGTFHSLEKPILKKHSSCFYSLTLFLILLTKVIKIKKICRVHNGKNDPREICWPHCGFTARREAARAEPKSNYVMPPFDTQD
jgi:hypothetical protein